MQSSNWTACGITTTASEESRTENFKCLNCLELAQYSKGGLAKPLWMRLPGWLPAITRLAQMSFRP